MCGAGGIRKISILSPQFCCEPKTVLKNKVLVKRNKYMKHLSFYILDIFLAKEK